MGDVINLNKARKANAKATARAQADANRVKFGQTKAEKDREKVERARADKSLDGAKLDDVTP